jgi:hypothetical protein
VRDCFLVGLGQAVDVAQDGRACLAILEIRLASAAELAHEEQDAVPQQGSLVALDGVPTARVGTPSSHKLKPGKK